MTQQATIVSQVNSKQIRDEVKHGHEYIVVPSYTLPFNVAMNGILYPKEEIVAHAHELEGKLAPLGHPKVNGKLVSASSPEGINLCHIGASNHNVKIVGNRVYAEKWIDKEVASRTEGGRELLARIEALRNNEESAKPISTSVMVYLKQIPAANKKSKHYSSIAKLVSIDHDAILLDEEPAASPEQGVGMMANTKNAIPIANEVMIKETNNQLRIRLEDAIRAKLNHNPDNYVWLADFNDEVVIVSVKDGNFVSYEYSIGDDDVITFSENPTPVARKESWVKKFMANISSKFFNDGDDKMTEDDRKALVQETANALAPVIGDALTKALDPINKHIETLAQANEDIKKQLNQENEKVANEKRQAIAKKFGEAVANSLSGEALDQMYSTLDNSAKIAESDPAANSNEKQVPDATQYFS